MKKIRITINTLGGGGAEKVLLQLLQRLNKKYEVDLFLINKTGLYLDDIPLNVTIEYHFRELIAKNIVEKIKNSLEARVKSKIYSIKKDYIYNLTEKKYDYEISFLEGVSTEIVAKSKNKISKKIAWVHTDLEKYDAIDIEVQRESYKKFDRIVCVSKNVKKSFLKIYPEYSKKIEIIYNLIDEIDILNKSKEEKIVKDKVTLVTVGRLIYAKGYDLLLNAIKNLNDKNIEFKLLILGAGNQENILKKYIKENKLENCVELLGFKKNPYPYIKASDIFISSSRYEGFSLVVAEAILLDKPIIATNSIGPSEILEDGKYGMLIPINDVESIEKSIEKLILDKKQREYYAKLSKQRKKIFNSEEVLKKIENLLERLEKE